MTYLDEVAQLIHGNLPPSSPPPDHAESLFLIYAVLARAKGEATTMEDVHDAWAAWMSTTNPKHDALVPFAELEPDVRQEDAPYLAAILKAARALQHDQRPRSS
jgi:hypothetical protein